MVVEADKNQIEQVVMNLVVNAADALPATGEIRIGTADVETLDMLAPNPVWQVVSQMSFPRRRPDLVTLPDGRLLAIGGSIEGQNSPECAMHAASGSLS